jgi:hypothetical protein
VRAAAAVTPTLSPTERDICPHFWPDGLAQSSDGIGHPAGYVMPTYRSGIATTVDVLRRLPDLVCLCGLTPSPVGWRSPPVRERPRDVKTLRGACRDSRCDENQIRQKSCLRRVASVVATSVAGDVGCGSDQYERNVQTGFCPSWLRIHVKGKSCETITQIGSAPWAAHGGNDARERNRGHDAS